MKRNLMFWTITLSTCAVLISAMVCTTTIYMLNGRYRIYVALNTKGLQLETDVDKRECN